MNELDLIHAKMFISVKQKLILLQLRLVLDWQWSKKNVSKPTAEPQCSSTSITVVAGLSLWRHFGGSVFPQELSPCCFLDPNRFRGVNCCLGTDYEPFMTCQFWWCDQPRPQVTTCVMGSTVVFTFMHCQKRMRWWVNNDSPMMHMVLVTYMFSKCN